MLCVILQSWHLLQFPETVLARPDQGGFAHRSLRRSPSALVMDGIQRPPGAAAPPKPMPLLVFPVVEEAVTVPLH
jgi:hypothetical protein